MLMPKMKRTDRPTHKPSEIHQPVSLCPSGVLSVDESDLEDVLRLTVAWVTEVLEGVVGVDTSVTLVPTLGCLLVFFFVLAVIVAELVYVLLAVCPVDHIRVVSTVTPVLTTGQGSCMQGGTYCP